MGLLDWLFGGRGRKGYDAARVSAALGPWAPATVGPFLAGTSLPEALVLPADVEAWGQTPGRAPLSDVLLPYWLRLDPALCGYLLQRLRAGELYHRRELPREGRAPRVIHEPAPILKFVQWRILQRILDQVEIHPAAHGFVKGRSIFTNALPHVGAAVVVNMDLRDFFPTITFPRVAGAFRSLSLGEENARRLAGLCCIDGRLPQGAPTSPMLSNVICRRLDRRLAGLLQCRGGVYTRYADDLTLSGPVAILGCLPLVRRIIGEEGFEVAEEKTAIHRRGARQTVTGLVVNDRVSVPRRTRRRLRALVHRLATGGEPTETTGHIHGLLSFVASAHPSEAERLYAQLAGVR